MGWCHRLEVEFDGNCATASAINEAGLDIFDPSPEALLSLFPVGPFTMAVGMLLAFAAAATIASTGEESKDAAVAVASMAPDAPADVPAGALTDESIGAAAVLAATPPLPVTPAVGEDEATASAAAAASGAPAGAIVGEPGALAIPARWEVCGAGARDVATEGSISVSPETAAADAALDEIPPPMGRSGAVSRGISCFFGSGTRTLCSFTSLALWPIIQSPRAPSASSSPALFNRVFVRGSRLNGLFFM